MVHIGFLQDTVENTLEASVTFILLVYKWILKFNKLELLIDKITLKTEKLMKRVWMQIWSKN